MDLCKKITPAWRKCNLVEVTILEKCSVCIYILGLDIDTDRKFLRNSTLNEISACEYFKVCLVCAYFKVCLICAYFKVCLICAYFQVCLICAYLKVGLICAYFKVCLICVYLKSCFTVKYPYAKS